MSSYLASTAVRARSQIAPLGKRFSSGHGEYKIFPFNHKQGESQPVKFAVKQLAFMGVAFFIPFGAIWFRWHKPGGIKNP
ncbi:hypothetical protein FB45DRAFT_947268 [Roridomyces roridus]|uniref:Cytochrome c oxidase subunit 8, mitochondrial n=1 Tax=Roridomyces roridus TaxID=1738132 RepID=A0AAD7B2Z0_9AGAR|nr:hypothetical protein FB45DRAFT_947268 [Roridomyces roridus]